MGRSLLPLSKALFDCIAVPVKTRAPVPASSIQAPANPGVAKPDRPIATAHATPSRLTHAFGFWMRKPAVKRSTHIGVRHDRRLPRLSRQVSRSHGSEDGCDLHR